MPGKSPPEPQLLGMADTLASGEARCRSVVKSRWVPFPDCTQAGLRWQPSCCR